METITLNGKTYYSEQLQKQQFNGDIKIVVLQRGWVLIGRFERADNNCKLHDASVIRVWGTSKGLGELASEGKKKGTVLDKCSGVVEFDYLTMVLSISVNEELWKNAL
jgi:hypothetical protein